MMKALVNTYCNDQSSSGAGGGFIRHVFMHLQKKKKASAALKYARYPKVGKKKSMKSNIPIGFSLCHRPISASRRVDHVCGGEWMTR